MPGNVLDPVPGPNKPADSHGRILGETFMGFEQGAYVRATIYKAIHGGGRAGPAGLPGGVEGEGAAGMT
jgi:hypothetical protein